MKTSFLFRWPRVVAAVATVGFTYAALADIPASAYVQDGLIAQWDGIDNAGTGTHDQNATTWVDLKGENNLTLTKVTFGENCAKFASGKAIGAQTYTLENGLAFEVYAKSTAAAGDMLSFQSDSNSSGFNFFCYSSQYRPYDESKASFAKDETAGMSVVVSENGLSHSFYKNGSYVEAKSYTSRGYQNLFVSLGVLRNMTSGRTLWNGSMYSVRVYNRVLSAGEIACNANLDKIRFNGMNPASLTWPEGYRWNSGTQKIECGIVIDMPTGGLVTVDDVDIGARYEDWVVMGTERTVKICATPIACWRFVQWKGEGLTAAERLSPTLTVTTRRPLVLKAAFRFELSAGAYLKKGLVAQWDGIENAGVGTHDPNATVWSNLVSGTSYNWSLASGKYEWEGDAVNAKSSLSTTGWLATMTGVKSIGYTTFETVVQPEAGLAKTTGSFFRQATRKGNIFMMPGSVSGYLTAANAQKGANLGFKLGDRFSTTLVYSNDGSAMTAVYKGGVAQELTTPTYGWAVKDQNMSLGGISASDSDYVFKGRIHTIRLYNRQLTANEVAYNANIDKIRFEGADPAALVWPDGYVWNETGRRIEFAFGVAYDVARGSVSIDGVAVEPGVRALEVGCEHELTATPAEGWRFVRWNGDVDPSAADESTIRLPGDCPRTVAAVFARVGELSSGSYVQTGLIAQWDAIENAGTGTHDAAATNWVDLVGNGGDLLLPEDAFEIGERQLTLMKQRATGAVTTLAKTGTFTGEAYCQATSDYSANNTTRSIFYNPQIGLYFRNTDGLVGGLQRKTDGKSYYWLARKPRATADIRQPHTYSTYATQTNMTLSVDGLEEGVRTSAFTSSASTLTDALSVGNTYVTMIYGSVRLYNRQLTAEETAHNAVVDRIRFLGAEQAEAGGWRFNAETQELEVRVSVRADGDGTVKVDDGAAGADASVWRTLSAEDTVTLTAEPAAGGRFVSWTGDSSLTAAQKTSATLTLPVLAARNLTAVFLGDDDPHWTYAIGSGTLTLGDTAFTVTASTSRGDGINISTLTSLAEDGVVDLQLPIVGDDGALYVLTSIGSVFAGNTVLTELYIPDTVTSIAGSAVKGATALGKVRLPATLTSIGGSAFKDCSSLSNIVNFLAPTVTSVGSEFIRGTKVKQVLYLSSPNMTATTTTFCLYTGCVIGFDMTGSGIKSHNAGWEFFGAGGLREVIFSDVFELFPKVNPIYGSCGSLHTFKFRGGPPAILTTDPINGMKGGFTWFAPKWDKRWEAYLAAQEDCTVSTPTSADCSNFLAVHPNEPIPTMKVSISKISNHLFSWWYPNPPPECEEVSLVDLLGYDGAKPDFPDGGAELLDGTTWTANTVHWTNGWYATPGTETVFTIPAAAKTARALKMKRYRLHQLCMGDKTYFKYANARAPTEWQLYGKRTVDSDWTLLDERTLTAESDVAWAYLKNPTTYPVTGVAQTVPPRAQCSITFDLPEEKQNCYCVFKFVPTKSYNVEHTVTADTTPIALMELEILGELPSSAPHVTACTVSRQGWTDLDFSVTIDSKGEQPALDRYAEKAYARVEIAEDATFSTLVSSSAQTEIDLGESVVTVPGLTGRTGYFARVILDNDLGFAVTNVLETATLQSPFELDDPVVGATDDGKLTVSLEILNLYAAPATAELWYAAEPGGEYCKLAEKQVDAAGVVALATAADGFPADAVGQVRITVTADGVSESRDKTPYGLWIVDRKALTMTHSRSGVAFNVTVAEDNVTLTSALDLGEETAFDLTAAVFDTKGGAMTLVSVGTAFRTNLTLQEVLLPDSVKTLSDYAFDSCAKLVKVRLPNALEKLGISAFNGCAFLEDISPCLPPTCTTIGSSAFSNCKALPRIDIPEGVKAIPDSFLNTCGKIREVRIPDSCTSIGTSAFYGCAITNLQPRVLPPQIKSVGGNAFRGFSGKIPELILDNPALTQIGNATFYGQSFGIVDLSKSSFAGFKNGWEFGGGSADEMILPPCCTNLCNPGNVALGTVRKLRFTGNPPMVGTGTNVLNASITTYYVPFHNGAWNRYLADHPDWVQPMTAADQKAWKDMMKKYFPNDSLIPRPKQKLKLNGIGDFRYLIRYGGGLMVILR